MVVGIKGVLGQFNGRIAQIKFKNPGYLKIEIHSNLHTSRVHTIILMS